MDIMGPSLRRKEESSYAVLLMVRGNIPPMYALNVKYTCCWYQHLHLLQFYALAPFEIMLSMCFRYNTTLSARIMGNFVNLAILITNHVHLKVPFPYMAI